MASRLLLVDDDADSREIYKQMFEWAGFRVETASNGPAGLRAAVGRPPDAVLVDLDMPGMNGIQVLRELRSHPRTAALPVAALTGVPELLDSVSDIRFDMVIAKPAFGERVVSAVRRLSERTPT